MYVQLSIGGYPLPANELSKSHSTDISPFFFPLLFYLGLYPEDTLEAAFADAAVDAVGDNHTRLEPTVLEEDMAKKVRFGSTVSVLHVP